MITVAHFGLSSIGDTTYERGVLVGRYGGQIEGGMWEFTDLVLKCSLA